jgi:hypothetical protein
MVRAGECEHFVEHGVVGRLPLDCEAFFSAFNVAGERADGEPVALE